VAAAVTAAAAAASVASVSEAFIQSHHGPSSIRQLASVDGRARKMILAAGPPEKKQQAKKKKKKTSSSPGKRRFQQSFPSAYDNDDYGGDIISPTRREDVPPTVMQTHKSIEELEQIMSKRWGTSGDKWTADFDEEELVYGDGDNDDDADDKDFERSDAQMDDNMPAAARSTGKKFKAKPVLDPWQKAAQVERKKKEPKANIGDTDSSDARSSVFGGAGGEDAVLDRVRRNQARMREKREANGSATEKKGKKDTKRTEFYDEDDEGYEGSYADEESNIDVAFDAIISPKPVSSAAGANKGAKTSRGIDGSDDSSSGGFFFRQSEGTGKSVSASIETDDGQQPERKQKKREPQMPSKRDEKGNELYLTLEQAEKNVNEYLASISNADALDGVDDDEDDPLAVNEWEDIGITDAKLLKNLRQNMRCPAPLSVQDKACPPVLSGSDVLVSTHTGSGKTLAFLAPLAQRMLIDAAAGHVDHGVKVVIVAPGRELASQIVSVARDLLEGTELKVLLTIGGTPFSRSVDAIRKKKPDIVVGTPGRIAELIVGQPGAKSGRLKINSLQTIVLDEFDALLEYKPHRDPTRAVMRAVKRRHGESLQSVLCSATAADMMGKELLDEMLRPGYAHAKVDEGDRLITSAHGDDGGIETTTRVSRTAIHGSVTISDKRLKLETLRRVLYTEPTPQQVLVFVDNSRRVGIVVDKLAQMGIVAAPLHGGYGSEKGDRAEVSKALREGFVGIVVATELAARGIDAPYLTHVINLDLPTDASHYAHRAGRCGRGGRPGVVVSIAAGPREKKVPSKFADSLGIEMNPVEPRAGKLVILVPEEKDADVLPKESR